MSIARSWSDLSGSGKVCLLFQPFSSHHHLVLILVGMFSMFADYILISIFELIRGLKESMGTCK